MRIKFRKGEQRKFIDRVIANANCASLRRIGQFGIEVNYQSLKSYYHEDRTLPESLFLDLCKLARISPEDVKIKRVEENWGQKLGGMK